MKASLLFLSLLFLLIMPRLQAQDYSNLAEVNSKRVKVYSSKGFESKADAINKRVDAAFDYYQQLLNFRPEVTLLVLSVEDWPKYTNMPVVGMPHYTNDKVLVVAAENNPFWKSFIPPMDKLPVDLANKIQSTYKDESGELSMQQFFDLLSLHELGHAFHFQGGLNMQRKWMGELFVNLLLHSFVAEKEPESLNALTLFPQMVIGSGSKEYQYTSLEDVHEKYEEIGSLYPKNYGWYQSRWHAGAGKIWDAEGSAAAKLLWSVLKDRKALVPDEELVLFFRNRGAKAVAEMIQNWDAAD